ncbi:cytochrome c oxidase assembly protein [Paenibacillus sp. SAF-054]|uniref:cytochrome c oxidase assembly protein n=1 Tax=unclassified Paenibacillus TaxID=185978 RepID=UPI003F7ECC92
MHDHQNAPISGLPAIILLCLLAGAGLLYGWAVTRSYRQGKAWPLYRMLLWYTGIAAAVLSVFISQPSGVHMNFKTHMFSHLLLGMLAPLLMAMAAPVKLLLRALSTVNARKLARLLKSSPLHWISHPAVAALLNIGGLWLLYTTRLYEVMHLHSLLYLAVHLHVFLAGYVFTLSILESDAAPWRRSFVLRAVILIIALTGHGILSKYIYAHPPAGVSPMQAEAGAVLMYYGGDIIEAALIFFFCRSWYRAVRPRGTAVEAS